MKTLAASGLVLALGISQAAAGDRWSGFTVAAGFGTGRLGLSTSSTYAQTSVFDSTDYGQSCSAPTWSCDNFVNQRHEDYLINSQENASGGGEWDSNAGLSFGYARQWGSLVLGAEAGVAWVDYSTVAKGNFQSNTYQHEFAVTSTNGGPYQPLQDDTTTQTDSYRNSASGSASSLMTFNAKLGFEIFPGVLLYATGGGARGKFEDLPFENRWGWLYGGGLEIAVNDNWSFRTEYRRIDFSDYETSEHSDDPYSGPNYAGDITQDASSRTAVSMDEVRASLAYRFSQ